MLLFDMDGTLLDSNGGLQGVDTALLAQRGIPYTKDYYEGVAHTIFPLAAKFTKEFCHLPESEEAIMAEWMDLAQGLYANVPVKLGVRDYLRQCQDQGIRMAVVTSSVPEHCRTALSHLRLLPFGERITFAQELGEEKTAPADGRKAAELANVAPEDCVMFDDSIAACRGAHAAGMRTVGVYDPYFAGEEAAMRDFCDEYIRSFQELLEPRNCLD